MKKLTLALMSLLLCLSLHLGVGITASAETYNSSLGAYDTVSLSQFQEFGSETAPGKALSKPTGKDGKAPINNIECAITWTAYQHKIEGYIMYVGDISVTKWGAKQSSTMPLNAIRFDIETSQDAWIALASTSSYLSSKHETEYNYGAEVMDTRNTCVKHFVQPSYTDWGATIPSRLSQYNPLATIYVVPGAAYFTNGLPTPILLEPNANGGFKNTTGGKFIPLDNSNDITHTLTTITVSFTSIEKGISPPTDITLHNKIYAISELTMGSDNDKHDYVYKKHSSGKHYGVCKLCNYDTKSYPESCKTYFGRYTERAESDSNFHVSHYQQCSLCNEKVYTSHTYTSKTTPSTCTDYGFITKTCSACYHVQEVPLTTLAPHSLTYYNNDSEYHWQYCTECSYSTEEETGGITAHVTNDSEWIRTTTIAPTCSKPGKGTKTCPTCGYKETETLYAEHAFSKWTLTNPNDVHSGHTRKCSACGLVETHKSDYAILNDPNKTYEPTCVKEGQATYECLECQTEFKESISKIPHTWDDAATSNTHHSCSSCRMLYPHNPLKEYYTDKNKPDQHYQYCAECGGKIYSQHNGKVTTKNATCNSFGKTTYECTLCQGMEVQLAKTKHVFGKCTPCSICGAKNTNPVHSWSKTWSTDENSHYHKCSQCSAKKDTDNHTDINNIDWIIEKEATDDKSGVKIKKCLVCDKELAREAIPPKNCQHTKTKVDDSTAVTPTCVAPGKEADVVCEVCGFPTVPGAVIEALPHTIELRDAREATCCMEGYTGDQFCTTCEQIVVPGEILPSTDHVFVDGWCEVCMMQQPDSPDQPTTQPTTPDTPTSDPTSTTMPTTKPTKPDRNDNDKKDGGVPLVLIIAIVVVLAGVGVFVFLKFKHRNDAIDDFDEEDDEGDDEDDEDDEDENSGENVE